MVNELVNDVDPETIKPKLWRWNDPHLYPIPKPGGDHCDTVLQPLLKKDKIQCDAWKDEVQNLLIFAGLFSAVVTGFAIDSYKRLQPDPNVVLTALLTHIAGSVDILANTSMAAIPPSNIQYPVSFSPSPSSIRINIFWFSSLILSLTTVIVGIVSLQWLREHQRYTDPLSSKQALAIFHMRAKGLEKWHIPLIFTGLPLLLQGAVVLFFVGVVEFLVALQLIVAIPVTLFIGIAIVFLVTTTFLPTIQLFKASLAPSSETSDIPAQCPYKSPQAWASRSLFIMMLRLPFRLSGILARSDMLRRCFRIIRRPLSHLFRLFRNILCLSKLSSATSGPRMVPLALCLDHAHRNWIDFDVFWLQIRDANFLVTHGESVFLDDHIRPPYDLVQALALAIKDHSAKEELVLAAYHAYRALSLAIVNPQLTNPSTRLADQDTPSLTRSQIRTLQSCFFPSSKFRPMTSTLRKPSLQMMHNESMFLFLYLPGISVYSDNPAHMIGIHRVELHTRIWVLNSPHRQRDSFENVTVDSGHPFLLQKNYLIPVPRKIPDGLLQAMIRQHYLILESLFEHAYTMEPGDEAELIRCHPMLDDFFDYIAWFTPPENLEPHFSSILRNISRGLDFSLDSQGYETADFVFFCARLYMEKVAHHSWFSSMMKFGPFSLRRRILDLLTRMIQYEHQLDKPRYCSRYAFWMSGLRVRRSRGIDASMFGVSYEPIPEDLLRFVPYDRKDSEDPSLKIEGHSPGTPSGEMQNLHSPGLIEYAEAWSTGITDSDHYG